MWPYSLLSTPVLGVGLFYVLPFEPALLIYLIGVCLAFWLYGWLIEYKSKASENDSSRSS